MSYKALYRIYRPKDFTEVAGQTHITTTLQNALANDKVAHAYLFSGPRGTGKTSIAKILAKAVNCKKAPIDNPCNVCENCVGIQSGMISDIIEIDAASNNGVDEIREIRDKVKYLPGYVKYKVYIIDEVHMLSTGAFNALLKTLEEPPAHVIFILCTTEPQKIPLTIHSRCQRFDFKAISVRDIIGKLKEIVAKENINIDEDAIRQIAIYSEGGLRDAISLLDQSYAYSPERITIDDINQISGAVSTETQIELAQALINYDPTKAIRSLNELIVNGKEVRKIALNLIEFFRDVLMFKNLKELDDTTPLYQTETFESLSESVSNNKIFYMLDILNKAFNDIKWSNNPQIYLELAFIKITNDEIGSESKIISVIDDFEKRLVELESLKTDLLLVNEKESQDIIENIIHERQEEAVKEGKPEIEEDENEEVSEEKEESFSNESETTEESVDEDISNTYPIRFVEEVLNNGDKNHKEFLIDRWKEVKKSANNGNEQRLASILESGSVVASSGDKIIVTFPSAAICNKLMMPSNKQIIEKLLSRHFSTDIQYMALPGNVFEDVTNEFINLWRQGKRNIKLSKIVSEGLKDVSNEVIEIEEDSEQKVLSDAKGLFGDIVRIKK